MNPILSDDEDVNDLFETVVAGMQTAFGYSLAEAECLVREYYSIFRDPQYCRSIGIPVQNDEFFLHEGLGMSLRIHYYLGLKGNPDPHAFIEWRSLFWK